MFITDDTWNARDYHTIHTGAGTGTLRITHLPKESLGGKAKSEQRSDEISLNFVREPHGKFHHRTSRGFILHRHMGSNFRLFTFRRNYIEKKIFYFAS